MQLNQSAVTLKLLFEMLGLDGCPAHEADIHIQVSISDPDRM